MAFEKGTSGNPAGRPVGTGSVRRMMAKTVRPHLETLVERLLAAALNGDANAAGAVVGLYSATVHPRRQHDQKTA